jgi:hypothetical protein
MGKWTNAPAQRSPEAYTRGLKRMRDKYQNDATFRAKDAARGRARNADPVQRAKIKDRQLKKLYDMTLEQYQQMHEAQQGLCLICRQPAAPHRMLAVDHDHVSGAVRGLLCGTCNTALPLVEDPVKLANALQYLADAAYANG